MSIGPDELGAGWLPSAHTWAGRPHGKPRWVIIHGTGYSLSQTAYNVAYDFGPQGTNENSTHYAVGRAGDIYQMVAEADTAWGNGIVKPGCDPWWNGLPNPNFLTISIEHVNDNNNATPLSAEQQAASFRLIANICKRWGIPMRAGDALGGILPHRSMDPVDRLYCPDGGPAHNYAGYPWAALWAFLDAQQATKQVPPPAPAPAPRPPAPPPPVIVPVTEVILPGLLSRCTEFVFDRAQNAWLTGDCGPDALAEAIAWADQVLCDANFVTGLYDDMYRHGEAQTNGISNIGNLATTAARLKLPNIERIGYAEPLPGWQEWLKARAGHKVCIINVANGQALVNSLTGKRENATNLHYHFFSVYGYHTGGSSARAGGKVLPEGVWAADGDNYDVGNVLQFYPLAVLAAAQPCGILAFDGRAKPVTPPPPVPASTPATKPASAPASPPPPVGRSTGYFGLVATADPLIWSAPSTNCLLAHGFLSHYQALRGGFGTSGTEILGLPISNEYRWGALTRQDFERGYLVYDDTKPSPWMVYHGSAGEDLRTLANKFAQQNAIDVGLEATQARLQAQLAAAGRAQAALQTQVDHLGPLLGAIRALVPVTADANATLARLMGPTNKPGEMMADMGRLPGDLATILAAVGTVIAVADQVLPAGEAPLVQAPVAAAPVAPASVGDPLANAS